MEYVQLILVYITLALALGYLIYKFLLPKSIFASKRRKKSACGQNDCGCH